MNKLTKVLSVFIIAGVIGTGAAGIAGCKKDKGHTHSYSYTDNADGTHNGTCGCGKAPITNEAHVDADGNKVCDKCDAAITSGEEHTHKYTYTDNGDGTHKGVCACGKDTIASEAHAWGTDGKCTKCGAVKPSESEEDKVESVSITGEATVKMGATLQFTATVTGTGNVAKTVTWSVENGTGEATISAEGLLTPVKEGKVTVKATSTADNTKSATKEITVTGLSDYEKLMARQDKLVADDFETPNSRFPEFNGWGAAGVYTSFAVNKDTAGATTLTHYSKAEDGKAVQVNPGAGTAYTVIDFGPADGVIEGYIEVKLSEAANSQTFMQFFGDSTAKTNSEVFGLRTDGGKIKYRLDGGAVVAPIGDIATTTNTNNIYFKFDPATHKMTVKIGDVVLVDVETTISSLSGFRLASGDGNTRTVSADNVVVCGATLSVSAYAEKMKAKLDFDYSEYRLDGEDGDYKINGERVTKAYQDGVAAITAASTIDEVKTAYATAVANMAAVLSDAAIKAAQDEACAQLDRDYPATNYTKENLTDDPNFPEYPDSQYNNKAAYEAAIAAAKEAIATKLNRADIAEELAKQKLELDKIKTDSQVIQAKIAEAQHRIEVYRADEIEALKDCEFTATYLEIVRAKKEQGMELLPQWRTVAEINEKLAHLRERIDSLIATTEMTPEEAKEANKAELEEYVTDKLSTFDSADEDDNEVIGFIEAAKQAGIAAIDQAETRGEANAQLIKARTTVAFIATRGEAVQRIKSYSADLKKDFYLAPALALFDDEAATHIANAKAVEIPETTGDTWEEAFETANQAITNVRLAAKAALDGKVAEATELELEAREAWSGEANVEKSENNNFVEGKPASNTPVSGKTYGSFTVNKGEGIDVKWNKSGYLSMFANNTMTIDVIATGAKLTIKYSSVSAGRYFKIVDPNGNPVGEGTPTTDKHPQAAGEYDASQTNKIVELTLGEAGKYTITFFAGEHKMSDLGLVQKETKQISGVVNSLAAVKTGSDTVVTAEIELEDKTTTTVTLNASEYTVDGGKIIFGTGKTAADANKYNSCNVPE